MVEIKLPEAKPAFEWVRGRALQKVSPRREHGVAQMRFASAMDRWARTTRAGVVATEWHFHVKPKGKVPRPLVPDVAFLSYKRVSYEAMLTTEEPRVAPDAVVEVNSPGDKPRDIEEKVRVYLAAGTHVVFLVNPKAKHVIARDASGARTLAQTDTIMHRSLPGFRLAVKTLFELPKPRSARPAPSKSKGRQ